MITDITGVSGSRIAYYAASRAAGQKKTLILVSQTRVAARLYEDISFFASDADIYVMPEEEDIRILYEAKDMNALTRRMKALKALVDDSKAIVIAPVSAALRPLERRERFLGSIKKIYTGMEFDPEELRHSLVAAGYGMATVTESPGEFSSRGGIVDVFPPGEENPVRIEFFGDDVDSIRSYDKDTQRSIDNISSIEICPAVEFAPDDEEINKALALMTDEYTKRIASLEKEAEQDDIDDGRIERLKDIMRRIDDMFREHTNPQIFSDYISYFDEGINYLWDYVDDGICMVCDPSGIIDAVPAFQKKEDFYRVYKKDIVIFTPFPEKVKGVDKFDELINVSSRQIAVFNGQLQLFAKEISGYIKAGYDIRIVTSTKERQTRIREYLYDQGVRGSIIYETGSLGTGMVLDDEKKCYITEADIFPNAHMKQTRKRRHKSGDIDFSELKKGDYVVHETHGIGRFEGIRTLDADGEVKDYLEIHYAGEDVLYIPTEQMDIIQRYIGSEGRAPKLSGLSGGEWRRTREKAQKAIMAIAEDLVELYAERESLGGYAFSEDTVWQKEFEEDFEYTETEDQLRAIEEIKADMERPQPMDRLLCGDVGYGKTEVAARAIFKCLSEGKQAILLAPTTLLVNQHYHTLTERFAKFPFNIEMLSRFKDESEQEKILEGLRTGSVDFVIGTHRLLYGNIKYKDLGLLVIDEEQRFGVKHKEKIKMMRKNVDVLTLSATPIPRTLNMSLTGIKNISMIEEPPGDRYPVQTFVTPEDDELIRSVVRREMSRGGQVYVVNNRIKGINQLADRIRELVPEAAVAVGHGQMHETNLENIMIDFVEGRVDVLVATTIIENGIDIPNANTMIVMNSDKLGLAQLYQLRGRVGRSNRIAYAYLLYKQNAVLTEVARKRLTSIREFTEFGAGFKLAMRDLEIRGAGNVLGEAQHGHISGIGYELYCKEIDRAVRRLNGEVVTEAKADITIEMDVPARIPNEYIANETLKLQAYKRIAQIDSEGSAEDVVNELIDRYGDIPPVTLTLIKIAEIRSLAEKLGMTEIVERGKRIRISFGKENIINTFALVMTKQSYGEKLTITSSPDLGLTLYIGDDDKTDVTLSFMKTLEENVEKGNEEAGKS